ncbi:MAG: glycosyltransferase family 4 protein [Chitinophagales bacterium]
MKRVLIISYYWPPSGGAGVQRWLKMVKYLPQFGWKPVVYTAKDAEYPIHDSSLEKDVPEEAEIIRQPIWEPYDLYKKVIGQKKEEKVYSGFLSEKKKPGLAQRASVWIRGNLFIPDARCFWIRPSRKFLIDYLKKNPVDAIVSTGPPHTTHMIALGVKKKLNIPWIADFRDPWTQIDFYDQLHLTTWADAKHKRMEKEVLKYADKVVTVSWHWADDLKKISGREVEVITNGFDEDDYKTERPPLDEKFSLTHVGSINADRNPKMLWISLGELCRLNEALRNDLVIRLVGKNDVSVYDDIEKNGLTQNLQRIDYLPHSQIAAIQQFSHVLLLPINDTPNVMGIIPGKIFEYLAAHRPILVIGKEAGDSARIVRESSAGVICGFDEKEKIKMEVMKMFSERNNLYISSSNIQQYSRRELTGNMSGLLNLLSSQ